MSGTTSSGGVLIFGASGCGTSTLGRALALRLRWRHLDADDYYWQETDPPYVQTYPPQVRLRRMHEVMDRSNGWILSGSVVGWGDALIPRFTSAVFVTLPQEVRLQRLKAREGARYGARIRPGGDMHEASEAFLEWAARYDTAGSEIRSRELHERWMMQLRCPIVRVDSQVSVENLVDEILQELTLPNSL